MATLARKWKHQIPWLRQLDGHTFGCKYCASYVCSVPKKSHFFKHAAGVKHKCQEMKAKCLEVPLETPPEASFQTAWQECCKGTSYRNSTFGRTQSVKLVYCLGEALMDRWRKKALKAVSGCVMQDSQGLLLSVRVALVHHSEDRRAWPVSVSPFLLTLKFNSCHKLSIF
jgi:hypothetical protein